jgi:hypothetical protein
MILLCKSKKSHAVEKMIQDLSEIKLRLELFFADYARCLKWKKVNEKSGFVVVFC